MAETLEYYAINHDIGGVFPTIDAAVKSGYLVISPMGSKKLKYYSQVIFMAMSLHIDSLLLY